MLPKIEFEFDEPVVLTLRYAQGREIPSKYYERWLGDTVQYMFSAEEGVFFLADSQGPLLNARLRSLAAAPGDVVLITKRRVPNHTSEQPVTEYFAEISSDDWDTPNRELLRQLRESIEARRKKVETRS